MTGSRYRLKHKGLSDQYWEPTLKDGRDQRRIRDDWRPVPNFETGWIDRARQSNSADHERPTWSPFFCLDLTCGGPSWRDLERSKAPKHLQIGQSVSVRLTGATGLEPATSGVTGRADQNDARRRPTTIACKSKPFRVSPTRIVRYVRTLIRRCSGDEVATTIGRGSRCWANAIVRAPPILAGRGERLVAIALARPTPVSPSAR